MSWDLAFDDPAQEREFRREMVTRHRAPTLWVVTAATTLMALQLIGDLSTGNLWWIASRLACLSIIVPASAVLVWTEPARFERRVVPIGSAIALAFVGYFAVTVPTKHFDAVGVDLASMLMTTLIIGIAMGTISLFTTRWIACLSAVSAVVSTIAAQLSFGFDPVAISSYASVQLAAAIIGSFTAHSLQASRRREHEASARSEALLHNVLPAEIAERLKHRPGAIAERFDEATVLFADLVGFTTLAEKMPPEQLVRLLDEVFSEFDEIAERHGLEKIKTIGDAYMVVGGVPARRDDHVEAVAAMALEMRAAIDRRPPLRVRIGLHTGPVVAGVIGKKKFIYDLWGDTVNTASRMESHGVEGGIQLTADVRDRLPARFSVESRGLVAIKGKGELEVFLLRAG